MLLVISGRYWEMVERLRLTHLYLAPTALRLLIKAGDSYVEKYNLNTLQKLGCGRYFDAISYIHKLKTTLFKFILISA